MATTDGSEQQPRPQGPRKRWAQEGRRRPVWQRLVLHGVLVVLSAIFLVPLFWLVGSSLKTDDQIRAFPPEWLPDIPYYTARSPYYDAYHYGKVKQPEACPDTLWEQVRPRLAAIAHPRMDVPADSAVVPMQPDGKELEALARGNLIELLASIPAATYARGREAVLEAAGENADAANATVFGVLYREIRVRSVAFKQEGTESARLFRDLPGLAARRGTGAWGEAAPGALTEDSSLAARSDALLGWVKPEHGTICGTESIGLEWDPSLDGFRNVTLRLQGDRSWREMEVLLRTPNGSFRTGRPVLLSFANWQDVILIRDASGEIPWGTYRLLESADAPSEAGVAELRLTVRSASRLRVVLRKLWQNYPGGLTFIPFGKYLLNTLLICALVVIGVLISCSLVAYGLARIRWRGRNALFYLIIATMMLPFQVTMVPLFVVFARLGWVDTFLPLFVPAFFGNAFFIFLLRQFFLTIPPELTDAARVDGCSEFGIYWRVVLPLARPALATVGLFAFMNTWNDYVGPLIYLSDASKYTLSLGLATFSSQYGSYPGMLMAVTAVMTIPIIILFFITQRTFIQGITLTGIKG